MPKHLPLSHGHVRMNPDTVELLRAVLNNPGSTRAELQGLLPHIDVSSRMRRLLGETGRVISQAGRYWGREHHHLAKAAALAARGNVPGVPPRTIDFRQPWTESYLSDAGVRKSGLEYRKHPSRRGNTRVYCYRKEA